MTIRQRDIAMTHARQRARPDRKTGRCVGWSSPAVDMIPLLAECPTVRAISAGACPNRHIRNVASKHLRAGKNPMLLPAPILTEQSAAPTAAPEQRLGSRRKLRLIAATTRMLTKRF